MHTYFKELICSKCGRKIDYDKIVYLCPHCGGVLETKFDYDEEFVEGLRKGRFMPADVLPIHCESYINIGQTGTPIVDAEKLSERYGMDIKLKSEFMNPTGSFKDLSLASGLSWAVEHGYKRAVIASSGNGAAAAAAIGAKAGIEILVYVPENAAAEKVKHAMLCGAKVVRIPGPYSNSDEAAIKDGYEEGICNMATTFFNPFTIDGYKIMAYEIFIGMGCPDAVMIPVGTGPVLVGILKGFEEIKSMGLIEEVPKMVCVQASGCSPIVKAYENGGTSVVAEPSPSTIAGAICDGMSGHEEFGDITLQAVYRSNGLCVSVTDEEITDAQNELANTEGIFVEPASAASIAAIKKVGKQVVGSGGKIVSILTGHGLKDMNNVIIRGEK